MRNLIFSGHDDKRFKAACVRFVDDLLPHMNGTVRRRTIPAGETLTLDGTVLWVVASGDIEVRSDGRTIEELSAKSVLGPWYGGVSDLSFISVMDGCDVVGYKCDDLSAFFRQVPSAQQEWLGLVSAAATHFCSLFSTMKAKSAPPHPKFRTYSPGEVILKEGEFGREVLCLVDGGADVVAGGAKVGKVKEEEIFGALAALTGAPRMASVVATQPSVCMVFERDDFEDLLRSHTVIMSKLFEDMARAMHEANSTIARFKEREAKGSDDAGWRWT